MSAFSVEKKEKKKKRTVATDATDATDATVATVQISKHNNEPQLETQHNNHRVPYLVRSNLSCRH